MSNIKSYVNGKAVLEDRPYGECEMMEYPNEYNFLLVHLISVGNGLVAIWTLAEKYYNRWKFDIPSNYLPPYCQPYL